MKIIKRVPFKMFGETRLVPLSTATNGTVDKTPRERFSETLWIERGEDWYGLMSRRYINATVLIVTRSEWLKSPLQK